jgi:HSP20 family molecular chaperone IbpA
LVRIQYFFTLIIGSPHYKPSTMKQNYCNCQVYPGSYVPVIEAEKLDEIFPVRRTGDNLSLPVNMIKMEDGWKVQIAVGAARPQDMVLHADNTMLYVWVLKQQANLNGEENFSLHEFRNDLLEREIKLPGETDPTFVTAQYSAGVLEVWVPKITCKFTSPSKIVIY